jgi:hypothetical protein
MAQDDIYERLFADVDRERARINIVQDRTPADVARAQRLARVTGVPAVAIEAEPAPFEAQVRRQQADAVMLDDEHLASWLANPTNAALARDDLPRMSAVSQWLQPWNRQQQADYLRETGVGTGATPGALGPRTTRPSLLSGTSDLAQVGVNTPRSDERPINWSLDRGMRGAGSMIAEALLRTAQGTAGLERARAEILGDQFGAAAAREGSGQIGGLIDTVHPAFRFGWQESAFSGLTSGMQMAMFAPAGGTVTLLGLSGTVGGEAYGRYRDRGATIPEATTGGLLEGAIEYATERLPIHWLLGRFGREGTQGFIRGYLAPEIAGEEVATFLQDAVDTAIANPNKTWAEYWAERPAAALDTAIATGVSLLTAGGAGAIVSRLEPQRQAADEITAAIAGQATLDTLMSDAEQSQVRQLDPESFSAFIHDRTDGTPIQNVYIPAEAVRTYLQTEGADAEFFEPYADEIGEALRLNGDLVLPIGEVAARLAGSQAWTALRQDVRLTPGGMSGREAQERGRTFMQELEDRGAEIAAEAQTENEAAGSAVEVYQQVRQELLAAGRSEQEADAIAQVVAARRESAGARMGTTAMAYHVANPIEFRQAAAGEGVAAGALIEDDVPAGGRTDSLSRTASWVIREKKTGKVVMETFDRKKVDALNTKKYEAVPIQEHLASLNSAEKRILMQDKARGQSQFGDDPGAIVTLFDSANFSTLIHELGHVFLEEMFRDAASAGAPTELKEDVAKIRNWFAANKHPVKKGVIPTAAHELFARGFERYAMEGKAPSFELRPVFAQFRDWLLNIYKSVQALRAPITPEIRGVMDRMLATKTAIDKQVSVPLFKSAEEAGMTEQEFGAYSASIANARDAAYDTLLGKMMESIRRRETQRDRDQRENVRAEVLADINTRPEFVALHLLRTGRRLDTPDADPVSVKLNSGWLIDNYGEDVLNQLPRGLPIIAGDGVEGDVVAEMTGMASGDQLVKALIAIREGTDALRAQGEKRSVKDMLVESEVERIMASRHGDVMTDGSIEEEAVAAINSARQGEIIAGEMRQLTKRKATLGGPTPYTVAREWAKRKISAGRVKDVASRSAIQNYIRATNRAAKAAEEAILKGDVDEAFRQKQAQLLNHALLAESKIAADKVDTIVARMKRYAGRKAMKSVDQDYFDRVHELLERFDFRLRSQKSIDEQDSFEAWAARRQAEGFEVLVPPRLANQAEHYTRVDVDTLFELDDAVSSIMALGRLKQKLLDGKEEREFNEVRDEIAAHIARLPDRKLPATVTENERRIGASAAASLLKVETIADELDNQDPNGPMNRLLVQGATRAATERDELTDRVLVPLAKTYLSMSKAFRRRMHDKVTSDRLTWNTLQEGDTRRGSPVTMTRMEWISVALNTGNLSNLEKMTKGERWPAPTLQDELNKILTKEDWDFAQAVWDGVGKLWPDIVRVERELSGVVPEAVEPLEIETKFGPYRGGYWPVVYDVNRSQRAENNADDEANDLFGFKSGIGTAKGHTITRTEAIGPLSYRLEEILMSHMDKVVTRIAYARWVRDVVRMTENPKVRGLIDTKLGPEYRRQIKPWLRRQINSTMIDKRGAAWWDRALRQFRTNMSINVMGFAYSTGVAQSLGLMFSAGRIGPIYVARGLKRMLHPLEGGQWAQDFVFSRSPEMQRRGNELNREVVEVFQKLRGGRAGWYTNAQAMAFWHIAMIDRYMVSMPTWLGAHQKGLDEGMTDEEASAYGDKIVRNSQGSGREKDLSAIQSPNSEAMRFFTMFYTPFNVQFNAQWDSVRAAKSGDWRRSIMLTSWFIIATALGDALMAGDWPDDEDGVGFDDLASWFGRNVFFGLWSGIPLARDASVYAERKIRGAYATLAPTPIETIGSAIERAGTESYQVAFEDEPVTSKWIRAMSNATGFAFGLPGNQTGKTGGFLWDVHTGDADPDSVRDWWSGLSSGRLPAEE